MFWSFPLSARPLRPFAEATPHAQELAGGEFSTDDEGGVARAGTIVSLDLRRAGARARLSSIAGPIGLTLGDRELADRRLVDDVAALARRIPVGLTLYRPDDISAVERMPDVVAIDTDYCERLGPLTALAKLESVHIESSSVGVNILRHLATCPLRQLSLYFARLRSIEAIAEMRGLRALRLRTIASAELRHLAGLDQLEHLELAFSRLAAGDLDHLRTLTQLTKLEIDTTKVTGVRGEGIATLVRLVDLDLSCDEPPKRDILGPLALPALRHLRLSSWPGMWTALAQLEAPALQRLITWAYEDETDLSWATRFPALTELWAAAVRTAPLHTLRELPALRMLSVGGKQLDDLAPLADLPLTYLDVSGAAVGDIGARPLATLRELRTLKLDSTSVTDALAPVLATLTRLEDLNLGNTNIGDAMLEAIGKLTRLRELNLSRTRVTDAALAHLVTLTALEELDLCRTALTDEAMVHIGRLTTLRRLLLRDVEDFTDEGYRHLEKLANLRFLVNYSNAITPEAEARLHAALPRLQTDC